MNTPRTIHTPVPLPDELVAGLHQLNPWWNGAPAPPALGNRHHLTDQVRRLLDAGLTPIVDVSGRQPADGNAVRLQIIDDLLAERTPPRNIMSVQFNRLTSTEGLIDPILRIATWLERSVATDFFNALAHQGRHAYLFLDQVQIIDNWSAQLKFLVDSTAVKVLLTGDAAPPAEKDRYRLVGRMHILSDKG